MRASLRIWWAFARKPVGEPAFWYHGINTFIVGYNYRDFFAFSSAILALALTALPLKYRRRPDLAGYPVMRNSCPHFHVFHCHAPLRIDAIRFDDDCLHPRRGPAHRQFGLVSRSRRLGVLLCSLDGVWGDAFARDAVYGQVAHSREDWTVKWKVFHAVLKLAGPDRGDLSR